MAGYQAEPVRKLPATVKLLGIAHHRHDGGGRGHPSTHQLHQLLGGRAVLGHRAHMQVILLNALVQVMLPAVPRQVNVGKQPLLVSCSRFGNFS